MSNKLCVCVCVCSQLLLYGQCGAYETVTFIHNVKCRDVSLLRRRRRRAKALCLYTQQNIHAHLFYSAYLRQCRDITPPQFPWSICSPSCTSACVVLCSLQMTEASHHASAYLNCLWHTHTHTFAYFNGIVNWSYYSETCLVKRY